MMLRATLGALALAALALPLAACDSATAGGSAPAEAQAGTVETIAPATLAAKIESGAVQLIDVRTPEEFAEGHIEGAVNVPLQGFDPAALPEAEGRETILYCRSDRRSGLAAGQLAQSTGKPAMHLDGGILAWQEAGLPVSTGAMAAAQDASEKACC